MKKLNENLTVFLSKNGNITNKSFIDGVNKIGIENVRFIIPMESVREYGFGITLGDRSDMVMVECKITEDRYKLKDSYKLGVVGVNDKRQHDDFYISDFTSLLENGKIVYVG